MERSKFIKHCNDKIEYPPTIGEALDIIRDWCIINNKPKEAIDSLILALTIQFPKLIQPLYIDSVKFLEIHFETTKLIDIETDKVLLIF